MSCLWTVSEIAPEGSHRVERLDKNVYHKGASSKNLRTVRFDMRELVEQIVRVLVDHPDQIKVREVAGTGTVVYELRVAKSDLGKVIGKQGVNAKAIRTILSAAGMKQKKRVSLEILED